MYDSEVAEKVQDAFEEYRKTQNYKGAILLNTNALQLSKSSVTSYLPYEKGVYFQSTEKEKISVGAERQRRYRAMKEWMADPTEENFWGAVLAYSGVRLKTYSGLPFTYEIQKGGMDNTQKNCGFTDVGKARTWRGVLCYWHWEILKRWEK